MAGRQRVPVVAVTPKDSHRRLSQAVNSILDFIDEIELRDAERAVLEGNAAAYATGAIIANYVNSMPQADIAQIALNAVAGTITIGVNGWYRVSGYTEGIGSAAGGQYGLVLNPSVGAPMYLGTQQNGGALPALVFDASVSMNLLAGTVLDLRVFASAGTYNITQASFKVEADLL